MKLILLPGLSPKNKEWIEAIEEGLSDLFDSTYIQYYGHWSSGGGMDIDKEEEKLIENVKDDADYVIFAKSAGIGITLKAISEKRIKPKKCIFIGIPFPWRSEHKITNSIPILFIQQTHDPFQGFKELKESLEKSGLDNYEMREVEGNDHIYSDIGEIKKFVKEFLEI